MPASKEFFIGNERFTPSQFKRLSRARKIEAMTQWFLSRYQDPVHETSYNGREGGYLWNAGGPYDALQEIESEFLDFTDFESIQSAAEEVTRDGTYEWAPVRDPNDYIDDDRDLAAREDDDGIYSLDEPLPDISEFDVEDGDVAELPELSIGQVYLTDDEGAYLTDNEGAFLTGTLNEKDMRTEMERSLLAIDQAVQDFRNLVRRSHNNPPELLNELPPIDNLLAEVEQAVLATRAELVAPVPDTSKIRRNLSVFGHIGRIIGQVVTAISLGVVGNIASDAFKGDFTIPLTLSHALMTAAKTGHVWISLLTGG